MGYAELPYPTPEVLTGAHKGSSVLIIGTGPSTKELVSFKGRLKSRFGLVMGLNFATNDFEDEMDYHVVLEKNPVKTYQAMIDSGEYRRDLPRILNWKSLDRFPGDLNIYKSTRSNFSFSPDISKYRHNGTEGLLLGPPDSKGLSVGSVMLNAIHLASIMGCAKIYMVGADLLFKDQYDHYYPDNHYRKSTTKLKNRSPIIKVSHKGKTYQTTEFFRESAKFIDTVIETKCNPIGIEVFDFSEGLITKAKQLNLKEFFGED